MKTRNFTKLILIAFMFVFTGSLKAQTEFAPVGAEWYYNYNNFWNVGYVKITSESDTIIDNVFCKKLVKSIHVYDYVSYNEKKGVFGYEYLTQINDSVMIYSDGEFKKLYDFSAEIGDTLLIPGLGHYEEFTHGTAVVTGKGFMEFEGESLRYIDLKHLEDTPWQFSCYHNYDNGYNTARICEKIGNISGYLLPEKYFIVDDDEGGALRCYSEGELSLKFTDEECDYVPESVPFPYTPFPTENAQWSVNNEKYALYGDTIINEKKYSKVYKQTADEAFEFDIDKAEYFCAIRNDVENKRVYGVYKDNLEVYNHYNEEIEETESLLYDFSLNLGDTIEVANFDEADRAGYIQYVKYVRVESIGIYKFDGSHSYVTLYDTDSIFCLNNGEQRKRILLNGIHESLQQSWIEGIGSSDGPFVHAHFSGLEYMPKRLLCFNENEECLYKQSSFDYDEDDDCFTNYYPDNVVENNENDIMIYPNPATTNVEVSYTLPEGMTSATLVMTNTLGVNVKTVHLDGNNGKTTLSLEELPSGIYFYTIRCGENVKSGKLVKRI